MADMIGLMNGILANGSTEYVERVPIATRTNIAAVGAPILEYGTVQNEFLNALIQKIGMQIVRSKIATNPLAALKRGRLPLGQNIEEIFVNMAEGTNFDPTGANLLTLVPPDVKTIYHRVNRQQQYTASVSRQQLQTAFTAWSKLEELVGAIANSLYSGDNYDEFVLMKNTIAEGIISEGIQSATVTAITTEATAKAFVKAVRNAVSYFQFPSSAFNKYADVNRAADPTWTGRDVITWTPREDQILIIRADVATEIDVEVLAQAFNMDKASLLARMVEVDSFGAATNCLAVLADKSFLQVYDNLDEMSNFYNPKGLVWTYFWNHWQTYSFSYFANALAFVTADVNIAAFDAIDPIDGGDTGDPVFANAAAVQAVLPDYVYAGAAKVPVTAWVDTENYSAAAAASYTFTATLGDLPEGFTNTGNVTATVEVVVGTPA